MYYPEPVALLINELAKLPGIGPKTAQRLAFYLINSPPETARKLAQVILDARDKIRFCTTCFNLTDTDLCGICQDKKRNQQTICVVQEPKDIVAIEKSQSYKGLYHSLNGALSPIDGVGPEDLTIHKLLKRLEGGQVIEVILATNSNVEGDATALYLAQLIKPLGVKVTRLAYGLPVGAHLEYTDAVTLTKALEGRQEVEEK
ncbi:recombinase RecR [Peptococcaceae bacterium SCADC1_2_3]|nr:recombinase RecR [Peptococcaceae bacterium SCADC1_2_3]KFI36876.1 recombinase RecR [Peptococcaceae bacterium SCADC1_2_3]HBQ28997.1 recombination protein RecR [Desulfotomaculum sp.]